MRIVEWRLDDRTRIAVRNPRFGRRRVEINHKAVTGKWKRRRFPLVLDDGRTGHLEIAHGVVSATCDLVIEGKAIPNVKLVPADLQCPACHVQIQLLDEFCAKCGQALGTPDRFLKQGKVQDATKAIKILAVLFAVSGTILFLLQRGQVKEAMDNLARFADAEVLAPIDGVTYTAGDLRARVQWEAWGVLVVNGILAVLMAFLAWWGKRKPLPAILVATAAYAVVLIGSAVADPKTIAQGFIVKIIIVSVLVKGIRAALELRNANG